MNTRNDEAVKSLASLIRVVSNALDMSQSALIEAVAKRLITSPLFPESEVAKFANDLAHHTKRCDNEQCGICLDNIAANAEIRRATLADQALFDGPVPAMKPDRIATPPAPIPVAGTCRMCGCTDADCSDCIRLTSVPCHWIEPDLCSACNTLTTPRT